MAPRPTVRNEQILTAIAELSRQVQARDEPLEARLDEMTVTLTDVVRRMDGLERAWTKEARRDACPFRDEIVGAANNKRRIESLEGAVHKVELKIAGWSVLAGGAMTAITALAEKVIEVLRAGGA